jgi:uncharacterized BrkB/YihY/UPF0761 family membrane protein
VFGGLAVSFLGPRLLPESGPWLRVLLALGAYVTVAAVVAIIFTLYRFQGSRAEDVVLGAALTATLIVVASAVYVGYLQISGGLQDRYGAASLATVVLLGLWLLVVNAMLIVGYRLMLRRARSRAPDRPRPHQPSVSRPRAAAPGPPAG